MEDLDPNYDDSNVDLDNYEREADIWEDEMAEGVTELDVDSNRKAAASVRDNRVYNLSGQCVGDGPAALSRLPQGIYIINGMKVVRR